MSYIPNFTPSEEPCVIPVFVEKRSRLLKNGLFFRSLSQGQQSNDLSIAVLLGGENQAGLAITQSITVKVYVNDVEMESFLAHQEKSTTVVGTENDHYNKTGFVDIRMNLNTHSSLIEMPTRSHDIEDTINVDPNDVVGFEKTPMAGAIGGPSDDSIIDSIRTGPESTLIGLKSTENDVGQNVSPSSENRIKKWSGTQWVSAQ